MTKVKTKSSGPVVLHRNTSHLASMVIGNGHSMMANFVPPTIGVKKFVEDYYELVKPGDNIQSFGLFGGDIDYNTYYPDLNPTDLAPKEEEFISPVFRLLSACVVSKNYNPTDFSRDGVLKASMSLLLGQTVNCDHETNIGNAIGSVSAVYWQEAYRDRGLVIPAGINGTLLIDGKANPRIARGIMMNPPSIHSNSVTVQFRWEKSHPKMDDNDFYYKIGTYDEKGQLICRVCTEIVRYLETSLVNHGADPYAQKVKDGKIINPQYANRVYSSFEEYLDKENNTYYLQDFKKYEDFKESTDGDTSNTNNINLNPTKTEMNELELFLASLFGEEGLFSLSEGQELNKDNALSFLKSLKENNESLSTKLEEANKQKTDLETKLAEKESELTAMKPLHEIGKNHFAQLREDTVAAYKKYAGENADEAIINLINAETTGIATVSSMLKDYTTRLEEKFPLRCSKCGSTDVNRASSTTEDDKEDKNQYSEDSIQDSLKKLYHNKIK